MGIALQSRSKSAVTYDLPHGFTYVTAIHHASLHPPKSINSIEGNNDIDTRDTKADDKFLKGVRTIRNSKLSATHHTQSVRVHSTGSRRYRTTCRWSAICRGPRVTSRWRRSTKMRRRRCTRPTKVRWGKGRSTRGCTGVCTVGGERWCTRWKRRH